MAIYAATFCLLLLAAQVSSGARLMNLQKIEYLVGDLPEYPQQLTITKEGMRYESHSNLSRPASLGIGVFERPLSKGEIEAIEGQFDPVSFRSLPDHRGQVLSGDRWRRIRLTAAGETIEKLVGPKLPIDAALQRILDRLDRLVDEVLRHPRSVLKVSLHDAAINHDGEFSAMMSLVGSGDQQVNFRPPQGEQDSANGSLVLYSWPHEPGTPKSDVQSTRAIVIAPASTAKLHGVLATFRIRSRIERHSSMPLAVQIQYSNMAPDLGTAKALVGLLFSDPIVVR